MCVCLLRDNASSPVVEQRDDVIKGEIPGNPLCDVTIGDCASSSVSSNFLVGWTTQARRPSWSRLWVLCAGNWDVRRRSFCNGNLASVRRVSFDRLAAVAHLDDSESPATSITLALQAGVDDKNSDAAPFCCCL